MTGPAGVSAAPAGYRLVQTIGHGASSTVYEAVQISTGRRVALKVLATSAPGGDAERLYTRERSVMAELGEHPHIVSIVDAGQWDGRFWLAMEYCPYGSVAAAGERLPVPDAVAVLLGVASALGVAHQSGLVHCDVKPANILRTRFGDPALADFGIARLALATGHGSTAVGYTLDHASPEVLDGERPTEASDVWSLGTALWELLEGRPPFRRADEVAQSAVIRRICFDPTPQLTRQDVPDDLRALIGEMTVKSPEERPSVESVLDRGRALQAEVGPPDPSSFSQTIVVARDLAPDALDAGSYPVVETAMPQHLAPADGQTSLPGARLDDRAVHGQDTPLSKKRPSRRPWIAVAASILAVALLAGGGVTTWRLTSASAAPPTPALPSTVTVAPPTLTITPTPTPTPVEASTPQVIATTDEPTTSSRDRGSDNNDRQQQDPPSSSAPAEPGIGSIQLTHTTCKNWGGGGSCTQTGRHFAYDVAVKDTQGNTITEGCTAATSISLPGKNSTRLRDVSCGSSNSFNASTTGTVSVEVDVTWNGKAKSRTFSVTMN